MYSYYLLILLTVLLVVTPVEAFNIKVRNKFENVQFEPVSQLFSNITEKEFIFDSETTYKNLYLILLSPDASGELMIFASGSSIRLIGGPEYKILKGEELSLKVVVASFKGDEFIFIKDKLTEKVLLKISLKGSIAKILKQRTSVNVEEGGTVRLYHDVRYKNWMIGAGIRSRSDCSVGSDFHVSYEW